MSQSLFTCSDLGANVVTVTVTDTDGNSANCTSTVTVTDPLVVCVLGIEDNELESSVRIFPNPTSGQVTLFNDSNMDINNITILDINGRIIKQITMDSTTTNINFSLVSLAQGMYFVKIENETTSIVKRILKQ
jgi:extracellular elastinolytic metalloproteinase